MNQRILQAMVLLVACLGAHAQVNSGSNGSDGTFNPTGSTVINMADHPDGIYHYTSVNISNGVTVTFIPNANNAPVVWLVQSNVIIDGTVNEAGHNGLSDNSGGVGGPGGYRGGSGGAIPGGGQGPGAGIAEVGVQGGNASYGSLGAGPYTNVYGRSLVPGAIYGNAFLIPLVGGSWRRGRGWCHSDCRLRNNHVERQYLGGRRKRIFSRMASLQCRRGWKRGRGAFSCFKGYGRRIHYCEWRRRMEW